MYFEITCICLIIDMFKKKFTSQQHCPQPYNAPLKELSIESSHKHYPPANTYIDLCTLTY